MIKNTKTWGYRGAGESFTGQGDQRNMQHTTRTKNQNHRNYEQFTQIYLHFPQYNTTVKTSTRMTCNLYTHQFTSPSKTQTFKYQLF